MTRTVFAAIALVGLGVGGGVSWMRPADGSSSGGVSVHDENPPAALVVDCAFYERAHAADPGRIRAVLRNTGPHPLAVHGVFLDGSLVPTRGVDLPFADQENSPPARAAAADNPTTGFLPCYWSRLFSAADGILAPGEVAGLCLQLTTQPLRSRALTVAGNGIAAAPVNENTPTPDKDKGKDKDKDKGKGKGKGNSDGEFVSGKTSMLATSNVPAEPHPVRIVRMAFAPDGEKLYVYFRNESDSRRKITAVEIDGRPAGESLWLPAAEIDAGAAGVLSHRPETPFAPGATVTAVLRFDDGGAAPVGAWTRAIWGFPLGVENGAPPPGHELDSAVHVGRPSFLQSPEPGESRESGTPPPAAQRFTEINLMNCVLCRSGSVGGDRRRTIAEFFRRSSMARRRDPTATLMVNPCRVNALLGAALFASAADALLLNPAAVTAGQNVPPSVDRLEEMSLTARLARRSASPGRFYPLFDAIPTGSAAYPEDAPPTPGEARARIFALLAGGADGLLYRHAWDAADPPARALTPALDAANLIVGRLHPWLEIGAPGDVLPLAGHPRATLHTRWAGERGMLIFLILRPAPAVPGESPMIQTVSMPRRETLAARVPLPAWARVAKVSVVAEDGWEDFPDDRAVRGERQITLSLSTSVSSDYAAEAFALHYEMPEGAEAARARFGEE